MYLKYEPKFLGVFSRNNIPRITDGANVKNLNDKKLKETHSASSFIDRNTAVYLLYKSIANNIFRIQGSIMCGFYCIAFIEYTFARETLLDYTNLFSPNNYKKNGKIIYNCFKEKYCKSRA